MKVMSKVRVKDRMPIEESLDSEFRNALPNEKRMSDLVIDNTDLPYRIDNKYPFNVITKNVVKLFKVNKESLDILKSKDMLIHNIRLDNRVPDNKVMIIYEDGSFKYLELLTEPNEDRN